MKEENQFLRSAAISVKEANLRSEVNVEAMYKVLKSHGRADAADKAESLLIGLEGLIVDMAAGVDQPDEVKREVFEGIKLEFGREAARIAKSIFNKKLHAAMQRKKYDEQFAAKTEKTAKIRLKKLASQQAMKIDIVDAIYVSETEKITIPGLKVLYKHGSKETHNRTGIATGYSYDTNTHDILIEIEDAAYRGSRSYKDVKFMVNNRAIHDAFKGYIQFIGLYTDMIKAQIEAQIASERAEALSVRITQDETVSRFSFDRQRWFLFKDREKFIRFISSFSADFRLLVESIDRGDGKG